MCILPSPHVSPRERRRTRPNVAFLQCSGHDFIEASNFGPKYVCSKPAGKGIANAALPWISHFTKREGEGRTFFPNSKEIANIEINNTQRWTVSSVGAAGVRVRSRAAQARRRARIPSRPAGATAERRANSSTNTSIPWIATPMRAVCTHYIKLYCCISPCCCAFFYSPNFFFRGHVSLQ